MRVLILGGTAEARALAAALTGQPGVCSISSLAGRVADPLLPAGEVRIGGFGGAEGLAAWLRSRLVGGQRIGAVIDATHPFAATISRSAAQAAAETAIPILALRRPGWVQGPGDDWHRQPSTAAAASALTGLAALSGRAGRVFLTTGRSDLAPFAGLDTIWFLIRSIEAPSPPLPLRHRLLLARGPFSLAEETELMTEYRVGVLVTKDSGGPLTSAKLVAARDLGLPVLMIDRPPVPDVPSVATVEQAVEWVAGLAQPG